MNKHPFSAAMREATKQALRTTGITKTQVADATGNGNAWVTKLLDGTIKSIKEETMHVLEKLLGIKYFSVERVSGQRSMLAAKIATRIDTDPIFARLATALDEALNETIAAATSVPTLPWFTPKELEKIGAEVTRIAYAWDEAEDPHYAKVGVETVKALSRFAAANAKKAGSRQGIRDRP